MKNYNVSVSYKVGVDANGNRSGGMPVVETLVTAETQPEARRAADAWLSTQSEHVRTVARTEIFSVSMIVAGQ